MSTSSERPVAESLCGRRVRLEYERTLRGTKERVEIPFVMGVMADLTGDSRNPLPPVEERRFLDIDRDSFDDCVQLLQPRVAFTVPNTLVGQGDLAVDITIECMHDFEPAAVVRKIDQTQQYLTDRERLLNLVAYVDGKPAAEAMLHEMFEDRELLERLASRSVLRRAIGEHAVIDFKAPTQAAPRREVAFLAALAAAFTVKGSPEELERTVETFAYWSTRRDGRLMTDWMSSAKALITFIDARLSEQVGLVLQHVKFQRLEGAWRGLHYLVSHTDSNELVRIRVMNISKALLAKTLRKYGGEAWDQSPLMREMYDRVYGNVGAEPYGCLVGDYYFDHSPGDVKLLEQIAQIAAASHAPFIAAAAPSVMGLQSWQELGKPRDIANVVGGLDWVAWRLLRESEDAKYIGLAMPRLLGRRPYGAQSNPVAEFGFEENIADGGPDRFTWMNPAYAMAVNINRAFTLHGWCVAIRGAESGGAVERLPAHRFPSIDGGADSMCPTELAIDDRREAALSQLGFMPVVHRRGTATTAFLGAQSLQSPAAQSDPEAAAAARLAARLPCAFAVSRVVQYLKCIARDQPGGIRTFASAEACERLLGNWLSGYVIIDPSGAGDEALARAPLWGTQLSVEEAAGSPGIYDAHLKVQIGYQFESFSWFDVTFRL